VLSQKFHTKSSTCPFDWFTLKSTGISFIHGDMLGAKSVVLGASLSTIIFLILSISPQSFTTVSVISFSPGVVY